MRLAASDEANRDALFALGKERRALRVLPPSSTSRTCATAADRRLHHRPLQGGGGRRAQALIRREVSVDGWFDDRYLKQALRTQGLEHYWTRHDAAAVAGERQAWRADRRRTWPSFFRRLARRAVAALGAPGRLDRRAWLLPCCCLWHAGASQGWISPQCAAAGLCRERCATWPSMATCGSTPPPAWRGVAASPPAACWACCWAWPWACRAGSAICPRSTRWCRSRCWPGCPSCCCWWASAKRSRSSSSPRRRWCP